MFYSYTKTSFRPSMDTSSIASSAGGRVAQRHAHDNAVTRVPLSRLALLMSWANRANGALLVLAGVLGFFGAFSSLATDMLSSALLSMYVGGFGALLLRYEIGAPGELRAQYGFMSTHLGRAAFLLLIGNLAWTCDPLGWPVAALTNGNALFSAYIMWAHPAFVEGSASPTALGGFDDAAAGVVHTGTGSVFMADPAVQARRAGY